MATTAVTMAGQMPGSGGSCNWDRPGSARQRTGGLCRATDETPACTAARVSPGPKTHAVMLLIPRMDKGQAG